MCNVAELPKMSHQSFVLWLNKQLSPSDIISSSDTTSYPHQQPSSPSKSEIVDIVWCFVQSLSKPQVLVASCAILTSSTIFIEKLKSTESTFPGMPELEPMYILPLKNIQQMIIGPCHSFLRLEEAFVGNSGTFTLYCLEPQGFQRLSQKVLSLCQKQNNGCDLDCIDLTCDSDLLKQIVTYEEDLTEVASDRIVLMIPVRLLDVREFYFLILSENRVYCVDLSCAQWPPPCFESLPEKSLRFEIVHEFSISDKLSVLKIHPDKDKDRESLPDENVKAASFDRSVDFTVYQLSLSVEIKNEKHSQLSNLGKDHHLALEYLFPCSSLRDHFLDRLSNLRAEQANRMSSNVREEPEGGNEQLSDSGSVSGKIKCGGDNNQNNCNFSSVSASSEQDDRSLRSIPCSPTDKSSGQTDTPDAESFRSFHSSDSVASFQSIIESESSDHVHAGTKSSSPREDLSISPMSNFSRASISPQFYLSGAKGAVAEASSTEVRHISHVEEKQFQMAQPNFYPRPTSKADSLPSSFDWKKFYFTAPPSASEEHYRASDNAAKLKEGDPDSSGSPPKASNKSAVESPFQLDFKASRSPSFACSGDSNETELDRFLKKCVSSFDLMLPLSTKMKPLCLMSGSELRKFFHSTVAQHTHLDVTEGLAEELHFVLWGIVIPYTNPKQEITSLIMLSTYAVYLVSDTGIKVSQTSRPSWMTHSRNQSDSAIAWTSDSEHPSNRKKVKPYLVVKYKELHQIHIGLFDQCVRLTGHNENTVFTIATKDSQVTEVLIEKLKQVLSLSVSSPMLERSHQDLEQDFYRDVSQRTKTTMEGLVYTHPSQVNFVYPGDEAVRDVLYLIRERTSSDVGSFILDKSSSLWLYIQCYLLPSDDSTSPSTTQPRTILMTATHFAVAEEDVVTYPLPDFVRGLPENPCHEILDCRPIDSLKRVHLYQNNPHWLTLSFVEEAPELVVDVTMQHFSHATAGRERQKVAPEVSMKFYIQNVMERDKLVQMLNKLWKQHVSQVGRMLDIQKI